MTGGEGSERIRYVKKLKRSVRVPIYAETTIIKGSPRSVYARMFHAICRSTCIFGFCEGGRQQWKTGGGGGINMTVLFTFRVSCS
jgi:hypothetical protein